MNFDLKIADTNCNDYDLIVLLNEQIKNREIIQLKHESFKKLCERLNLDLFLVLFGRNFCNERFIVFNHNENDNFAECIDIAIKNNNDDLANIILDYLKRANLLNFDKNNFMSGSIFKKLCEKKYHCTIGKVFDCSCKQFEGRTLYIFNYLDDIEICSKLEEESHLINDEKINENEHPMILITKPCNEKQKDVENKQEEEKKGKKKNENEHPMILIAKSCDEKLLKHPTFLKLLELKWNGIPFYIYFTITSLLFLFIISFSLNVFYQL